MTVEQDDGAIYVDVLLPLALPRSYTYAVPLQMHDQIGVGIRVEVPLKNKLYAGLVRRVHSHKPPYSLRNVNAVIDEQPVIHERQMKFWEWIAEYYCCDLGEVMKNAMPAGLKLSSETKFLAVYDAIPEDLALTDHEYLIVEALSIQQELSIGQIQDIVNKKTVYPLIKSLMLKRAIIIKEELKRKYAARSATFLQLDDAFINDAEAALEAVRSEKQKRAILAYYSLARKTKFVSQKSLMEFADVSASVVKGVEKNGVWMRYQKEVSRITLGQEESFKGLPELSPVQQTALDNIRTGLAQQKPVLLHGVTGSGKTRLYLELIKEALERGEQVLYLLPEIALTDQMVNRIHAQLGDHFLAYHSRINDAKRVEIWNAAMTHSKLFIGARSSIFLPFYNLSLIVIDEEHDPSFKQQNPAPRYHGRDVAIKLAYDAGAQVILGTATPSLESFRNAQVDKYHYVPLLDRYGEGRLPSVEILPMKEHYKKGLVKEGFSQLLIQAIEETLRREEQVLLFQNRRGYSPVVKCGFCGFTAECQNCDVTLTYHRQYDELKCHYCGTRIRKPKTCPACGKAELEEIGIGTERIEETIKKLIPNITVARFDYDTTRSQARQHDIITRFKERKIQLIVGTQMVTKGFDFENIGLVGVVSADGMLSFPDFRASERCFQLLMQVGGRAGRRQRESKMLIQAFHVNHPVLQELLAQDMDRFFKRELAERKQFLYPPFYHIMMIWFQHKDLQLCKATASYYYELIQPKLGGRCLPPVDPPVLRLRGKYLQSIMVKVEKKSAVLKAVKKQLGQAQLLLKSHKTYRKVWVYVDVDPA